MSVIREEYHVAFKLSGSMPNDPCHAPELIPNSTLGNVPIEMPPDVRRAKTSYNSLLLSTLSLPHYSPLFYRVVRLVYFPTNLRLLPTL